MPLTIRACAACLAAGLLLVPAEPTRGAEIELLDKLPGDSTNFVAVVHVRDLLKALNETSETRVVTQGTLPAWLDRLVVGSQVRIGQGERVRTFMLAEHPQGISLTSVARPRGGLPDRIGGHSAFYCTPSDYLIEIAPRQFALVRPGVRQEVTDWIRKLDAGELAPLTDPLREAASQPGELVIALDLQNALFEARTKLWLDSQEAFAGQKSLNGRLAKLAASASAVSVAVAMSGEPRLEVRIVFSKEIDVEPEELQQAIHAAIAERGASIPELDAAEPALEGRSFVMSAPVGAETIRKLLSLVLTPQSLTSGPPDAGERQAVNEQREAREYVSSVNRIVVDLDKLSRRATDYLRTATWHDNFAHQIEELPTAGVPGVFVDYGDATANRLRALAASLRGQAVTVDAQRRSVTYDVRANPGYVGVGLWGGWAVQPASVDVTSNVADVRQRLARAIADGARDREQIWQLQAEDRQRTLRTFEMTYGTPFEAAK